MPHFRSNIRTAQFGSLFSEGVETDPAPTFEEILRRRSDVIRQNALLEIARCLTDLVHIFHPVRIGRLPGTLGALFRRKPPAYAGGPGYWNSRADGHPMFAARDLRPATILDAYGRGYHLKWVCGNALWHTPARRFGGNPADANEPQEALALLRSGARASLDRDFDVVASEAARESIRWCRPFQPGSSGLAALAGLHDAGYGHSVEIKDKDGQLIGGCYGLATGRIFITEAKFGQSAAADLAIVILNRHLARWGFAFNVFNPALDGRAFGYAQKNRQDIAQQLTCHLTGDKRGRWLAVPSLCDETMRSENDAAR